MAENIDRKSPAHDELQRRWFGDRIERWIHYKRMQYLQRHVRSSTMGNIADESASFKRGDLKKYYPYQEWIYQCPICEKQYTSRPHEGYCEHCDSSVIKINQGISGKRVFASMIHPTGPRPKDWKEEEETDDAIQHLSYRLRSVFKMNYLDDRSQTKKAEALRIGLTAYKTYLSKAEHQVFGYLLAKKI